MAWTAKTSVHPLCDKQIGYTTYLQIRIFNLVFHFIDLCGCETWSLTLREEHRLRVFENMVLRGIFGPKRDGVTGEWRKIT